MSLFTCGLFHRHGIQLEEEQSFFSLAFFRLCHGSFDLSFHNVYKTTFLLGFSGRAAYMLPGRVNRLPHENLRWFFQITNRLTLWKPGKV